MLKSGCPRDPLLKTARKKAISQRSQTLPPATPGRKDKYPPREIILSATPGAGPLIKTCANPLLIPVNHKDNISFRCLQRARKINTKTKGHRLSPRHVPADKSPRKEPACGLGPAPLGLTGRRVCPLPQWPSADSQGGGGQRRTPGHVQVRRRRGVRGADKGPSDGLGSRGPRLAAN